MTDYVAVLTANYPSAQWVIYDNDYSTLQWFSETPKPSKKTLDDLWASVQTRMAAEAEAKVSARQSALSKLGLTADEVQALFG